MNAKEKDLQFLQIVRVNGNLYHLTMSGWTIGEIMKMMNYFLREGMVTMQEGRTFLTQKGNKYFKYLNKSFGKKGIARFLIPATNHKFDPLSKESIYLPHVDIL